jgi:hypothetical protein
MVRVLGFHTGGDSSQGVVGRDPVQCCGVIPTFHRLLYPEDRGSMDL